MMPRLAITILCCYQLLQVSIEQSVDSDTPQCRGQFDLYFVLDSSGSVIGHFQQEIVPFVRNVTLNFINPNFRFSFVTFATTSTVLLQLTSNRENISMGLLSLSTHTAGGGTRLAPGLQKVNEQIDQFGGDTAGVVIILTDGVLGDGNEARREADTIRSKGGSIFAIGVANADRSQLLSLVNNSKEVFIGGDFQYLHSIIDQVINDTCIEINTADPLTVCVGEEGLTTTLTGRGFTNTPNLETVRCRFLFNESQFEISSPVANVTYNTIICGIPTFRISQQVLLQVSLNGISYISSNVTMIVNDCPSVSQNVGLAVGFTFGLLALVILLALLILWFFLPLLTGKIFRRSKPPARPKEPEQKPKKWATVDASMYGGRGVGGITPVTVYWGDKGATEEGNKLTPSKDANIVKEYEVVPKVKRRYYNENSGLLSRFWAYIRESMTLFYLTVSSVRPIRDSNGKIMWCPYKEVIAERKRYQLQSERTTSGTTPVSPNSGLEPTVCVVKSNTMDGATRSSPSKPVTMSQRANTIFDTTRGKAPVPTLPPLPRINESSKPPTKAGTTGSSTNTDHQTRRGSLSSGKPKPPPPPRPKRANTLPHTLSAPSPPRPPPPSKVNTITNDYT